MTNSKKEIAKFFCGVEAWHAFVHTYFWLSGKTVKVFGLKETPEVHLAGAIGNAVALGVYPWGQPEKRRQLDSPAKSETLGNDR